MITASSRIGGAVAAIALLTSAGGALAWVFNCPARCSVSGPNSGNWSAYPSLDPISRCPESMFYDFSLYDPIDDRDVNHRVLACSSYGPDFAGLPAASVGVASADTVDVDYEIGWWSRDEVGLAAPAIRGLVRQTRHYLGNGHGPADRPLILFAKYGAATMGIYVGQDMQKQHLAASGLRILDDYLNSDMSTTSPSLAMQLCEPGFRSSHIFGVVAMSNATFNPIQNAIQSWANATCLPFLDSHKFSSQAVFTAPLVPFTPGPGPSNSTTHSNSRSLAEANSQEQRRARLSREPRSPARLHARANCNTIQVVPGDSCAALATRCGISGSDFTKYNPAKDLCAKLVPKQHVCCSKGDLPDFRPQKGSDGSCASYQVKTGDNCGDIAAQNGLKMSDLEDFNKKTWGWNGCKRLLIDTIMCLSKGDPPFPAPMANALCGPQVPGTKKPTDGTDIKDLNPCPLNACCDVWGQCGITKEFCTDTGTGAPGTAKAGTNGCISNCGTDVVKGKGDGSQRVAYYQGYGLARECLFQDALQIDTSKYTHVHFGFGTLTPDFKVDMGNALSSYEFKQFKRIGGAKRILSFGGWDFSTKPATFSIFRRGVTPENRFLMASNIANFVIENGLDGVDIDWEYPGAPDIPGIPAGGKDDGLNYLYFLVLLKKLLGGRSVSIAAPSSYWYLKQYPIKDIARIIDYIVFMTYDLHGQWDSGNRNSQVGCDTGNCLRSQVNLTETQTSLAMITKAGVPAEKVVVGITSYGRSFKMAEAGCYGPSCVFTGDDQHPQAAKGMCTNTAGILASAEIADIIAGTDSSGLAARVGRVTANYVDPTSNSRILVYDDVQWVDYMDDGIKATRQTLYKGLGFAGTTDWASDLQTFNDPPAPVKSWAILKQSVMNGKDPKVDGSTHGNWTSFDCKDDHVARLPLHYPSESWKAVGCYDAWQDAVRNWKENDSKIKNQKFSVSVAYFLGMDEGFKPQCEKLLDSGTCANLEVCQTSAAGQFVWNSLVKIKVTLRDYNDALLASFGVVSSQLADLENTFAPVPPEHDSTWQNIIIDFLSFGVGSIAGPFLKSYLGDFAYFQNEGSLNKVEGVADLLMEQGTAIVKNLGKSGNKKDDWKPKDQAKFSSMMGQTVLGWSNVTGLTLAKLFDGSDESIEKLGSMIADGQLLDGKTDEDPPPATAVNAVQANILSSIFSFAIPTLWRMSGTYAFVMDSGLSCHEDLKSMRAYLDDKTMKATGYCYQLLNKQYYLVQPKGSATTCSCTMNPNGICAPSCNADNTFSAPTGLGALTGETWGGLTLEKLVIGSVNTYNANGGKNVGKGPVTVDPANLNRLMNEGATTPGFIRLPVCSSHRAFQSWSTGTRGSSENYPCDIPPGSDECGDSTFVNEVSAASPWTEDCRQLVAQLQEKPMHHFLAETARLPQTELAHAGTCAFGATPQNLGPLHAKIGAQDIIDIINSMMQKFPGGKMGGKGRMLCNGDTNDTAVTIEWGIYHHK